MPAIDTATSLYEVRFMAAIFLYHHGISLLKNLEKLGDKVIIDAGCWVGDSILVFRKDFPKNRIYSFEPNPEYFQLAQETISLNNIDNVVVENWGLGEARKKVVMDGMHIRSNGSQTVQIDTLDSYVDQHGLRVGLIKTDLEGYEPNFLEGAQKTIKEQKPILLISIYHNYHDFFKIKPLIESWNLGYSFDFFKGIDEGMGDIMLLAEVRN